MKFNFDKKEYDTDNLSPEEKLCVKKSELSKEEKEEQKTGA